MAKVFGNVICKNGISEILRCMDSIYPICDEIYVCDDFSTDGTWELLKKYKRVYKLKLFQHKYEDMDKQRNWLLKKTPINSWIIEVDQDEKLSSLVTIRLRKFLDETEIEKHNYPIVFPIPFYNLIDDVCHHSEKPIYYNTSKIFYYDAGLRFHGGYHANLSYDGSSEVYHQIKQPEVSQMEDAGAWGLLHYAWLNPDRIKNIKEEVKSGKRDYKEYKDGFNDKPRIKFNLT